MHYYTHFDNLDMYYSIISSWKKNKNGFIFDGEKYTFNSKKGVNYRKDENNNYQRNFEYTIKNEDKNKEKKDRIKKFTIILKSESDNYFYGKSAKYGDYKPYKARKGEGIEVEVITVYYNFSESQKHFKKLIEHLGFGSFWKYQNFDKIYIRQNEKYLRYNEKKESKVGNTLDFIDQLIGLEDNQYIKITRDREDKAYKLYSIRTDKWNKLGFDNNDGKWRIGIKTYRMREYQSFPKYHPLRQPKLEVYLDEKKNKEYIKYSDFKKLDELQHQIIGNVVLWSKIKNDDFIGDEYFNPEIINQTEIIEREKVIKKLKHINQCKSQKVRKISMVSQSCRDYLKCLVINRQATYENLMEHTGLGKDWIKKLTYKLEKEEVIEVIRTSVNIIQFTSKKLWDFAKRIMQWMDDLEKDSELNQEQRKEERIEKRERRKRHTFSRKELSEDEIKICVDNNIIEKRNGGTYEIVNFEIIEPEYNNLDYENNFG